MPVEERISNIRREDYTFCDVCGRKIPLSQIGGQCVACNRRVCTRCTELVGGRVYCVDCAPRPPPPPPPSTGGCFIATAAYGTPLTKEVQLLRKFRDRSLNTNGFGQLITAIYYKISPGIAERICVSQSRRRIVRIILRPIIKIVKTMEHQQ